VPTLLLDENIDGYADYLAQLAFSPEWSDLSSRLGVRIVGFEEVGLPKGTPDEEVWEFCQRQGCYLVTDNRNQHDPGSLETMIRTRNLSTSLPVFTISDINRLRHEREYAEAVVTKTARISSGRRQDTRHRSSLPAMIKR
jgi:hypothetical protein